MSAIPGFVGGAYEGANPVSAYETCVNLYPSAVETPNGSAPAELLPTPGYSVAATAGESDCRAAFATGPTTASVTGRAFFIFGTKLYELTGGGSTLTERGTVVNDGQPATIASNGEQLLIVAGGNAYSYILASDTLATELTGGCVQGGVVDGYGVVFRNRRIERSDLFDLTTWDPLEFAERSIQGDAWESMLIDPYGYITLLGSKTGESWSNQGTATGSTFPFAPDRSGLIEEGILAPWSLRQAGRHKVWLALNANGGYQVLAAQGFQTRRISTHGIEQIIADMGSIVDAIAETYEEQGHAFYLLTFPNGGYTLVYDFSTGLWHRRASQSAGAFGKWPGAFHCFYERVHYFGAADTDELFALDPDLATDDGETILREREFSPGGRENQRIFYDHLEVLCQSGVGLSSGSSANTDPKLSLYVSDDYGRTFGSAIEASIGTNGAYGARAQWWGLGSGHGRRYRLRMSAAVPWRLTAAYQKVRPASPLEAA